MVKSTDPEFVIPEKEQELILQAVIRFLNDDSISNEDIIDVVSTILEDSIDTFYEINKQVSFARNDIVTEAITMVINVVQDLLIKEQKQKNKPYKVSVKSGDGKTDLGYGTYVDDVTVYTIQNADGSLISLNNAEQYPESLNIPQGSVVRESKNNPKIILDSGKTVYGCQVWWEPVVEAECCKKECGCH